MTAREPLPTFPRMPTAAEYFVASIVWCARETIPAAGEDDEHGTASHARDVLRDLHLAILAGDRFDVVREPMNGGA